MNPSTEAGAGSATRGARLRLEGRDALDLLHRISTAFLADLAPGGARATLFCDFRGRLLHRAAVARTADGRVWMLRADADGAPLVEHLDHHVFRDDVRIADALEAGSLSIEFGPPGPSHVEEAGGAPSVVTLETGERLVWRDAAEARSPDHAARIRAGLPWHGREIRDAFHPLEVGLAREVHLSKGCYTGQEVLLRLVTYGGVRRGLARLTGAGPAPPPGTRVQIGGEDSGEITSAAPTDDGFVSLALVRREALAPGQVSVFGVADPVGLEPFPPARPAGLP